MGWPQPLILRAVFDVLRSTTMYRGEVSPDKGPAGRETPRRLHLERPTCGPTRPCAGVTTKAGWGGTRPPGSAIGRGTHKNPVFPACFQRIPPQSTVVRWKYVHRSALCAKSKYHSRLGRRGKQGRDASKQLSNDDSGTLPEARSVRVPRRPVPGAGCGPRPDVYLPSRCGI